MVIPRGRVLGVSLDVLIIHNLELLIEVKISDSLLCQAVSLNLEDLEGFEILIPIS